MSSPITSFPDSPPPPQDNAAVQPALSLALPSAVFLLVMALLASEPLTRWARDLPVGPVSARIVAACDAWNAVMDGLGLTRPYRMLNEAAQRFQALGGDPEA